MIEFLKTLCNLYDLTLLWVFISIVWSYLVLKKQKYQRVVATKVLQFKTFPRLWKLNFLLFIVFLLICSTSYVPKKLLFKKESTFPTLDASNLDTTQTYYIHVLGSGFYADERLYSSQNLVPSALARLTEGIRVYHQLPKAKLVTSGYSKYGITSQAAVARKAAIELGIPAIDVYMLETPSTTSEEAAAFIDRFGKEKKLIVSSDASHLPRAIQMYEDRGIKALAAPTNFTVKVDANSPIKFTFPSGKSFGIANDYFVIISKEWYYKLSGK